MEALVVVLHHDLPVRLDLVDDAHADPELVELEAVEHRQALGPLAHLLESGRGSPSEVHEDEAREGVDVEAVERVSARSKRSSSFTFGVPRRPSRS